MSMEDWNVAINSANAADDQQKADEINSVFDRDEAAQKQAVHKTDIMNAAVMTRGMRGGYFRKFSQGIANMVNTQIGGGKYNIVAGIKLHDGSFAYLAPSQSEPGKYSVVQKYTPKQQAMIFQNAGAPFWNDYKQLYDGLLMKNTPSQLQAMGFKHPGLVTPSVKSLAARMPENAQGLNEVGGTTDGKATSRLFGRTAAPKPHSAVSAFGANGNGGGFTNYVSNADTGYNLVSADSGTRADKSGRWVQTSVGPDDDYVGDHNEWVTDENGNSVVQHVNGNGRQKRVFMNTATGETYVQHAGDPSPEQITADRNAAMVKGGSARGVRGSGTGSGTGKNALTFEQRKELKQMDIASKKDRQEAWIDSKGKKYDPKLIEALREDIKHRKYETNDYGEIDETKPRKMTDEEKADVAAREKFIQDILWSTAGFGGVSNAGGDGVVEQQPGQGEGSVDSADNAAADMEKRIKIMESVRERVRQRKEELRRRRESGNVKPTENGAGA